MNKPQEPARPGGRRSRLSGMPAAGEPRLALSGLVHRALLSFQERDQQRRRLINMLILAQALLFIAAAPAYIGSTAALPSLIIVGVELAVCLVAWVLSQFLMNAATATYLLVVGGSLAVLGQVFVAALGGDTLQAAHASLLLLTIILEAGLLFAPEVTLLVALGAVVLSGVGLVLALAIGPAGSSRQEYVLLVSILGLQVVTALIAWLLSGFIYDTAIEAERAHALQFAQVRLDALTTQMAEQHRQAEAAVASLQDTLRRVLAGETSARSSVSAGDFSVLSGTLNVVLERLDALAQPEGLRQARAAGGPPLIDLMGHAAQGVPTVPAPADVMPRPGAHVGADSDHLQRRLARVQQMSGELLGALVHSQDGFTTTAQNASEALRTVGAAIAAADGLLSGAQHSAELAVRVRRSVGSLATHAAGAQPDGAAHVDATPAEESAQKPALHGLGPDLDLPEPRAGSVPHSNGAPSDGGTDTTGDAPDQSLSGATAEDGDELAGGLARELAADSSASIALAQASGRRRRGKGGEFVSGEVLSAQLAEVSPLLAQLEDDLAQQEQAASAMTHELGIVNRNARGVDVGVAWAAQAVEAIRRNAERLYQTAGGSAPPSVPLDALAPQSLADLPARAPQPTRPLSASVRLSADALAPDPAGSASPTAADESSTPTGDAPELSVHAAGSLPTESADAGDQAAVDDTEAHRSATTSDRP